MKGRCAMCDTFIGSMHGCARYCRKCLVPATRVRSRAIACVQKAIRIGQIPRADTLSCVDCGKRADGYDHRDYSRPLDVDPVCRGCNGRRGPGKYLVSKSPLEFQHSERGTVSAEGSMQRA